MHIIKEIMMTFFTIFNEMSCYLLLGFLFAGILHVLVPQQIFSKYLSKNNWLSVLYATLFGIPLPLCSCGVIPTAMSLYKEGASKGAVISFLIATPQTGIDSIIATYSLMGLPFAIIRPIVALCTALFAGLTTNFFTAQDPRTLPTQNTPAHPTQPCTFIQKIKQVFYYGYVEMMEDIGKMLLIGLLIAGLISYFVPDNFFLLFGNHTLLTMLLVLLVAVPMYVCATGSIPIAIALMLKGMSPGTALVLLMAGPAANVASMLVIGKVLGRKTFILYLATLVLGAISFGLIIDNFLPASWFALSNMHLATHHDGGFYYFKIACSMLLIVLFINAMLQHKKQEENADVTTHPQAEKIACFQIHGMRCNHCKSTVTDAIAKLSSLQFG